MGEEVAGALIAAHTRPYTRSRARLSECVRLCTVYIQTPTQTQTQTLTRAHIDSQKHKHAPQLVIEFCIFMHLVVRYMFIYRRSGGRLVLMAEILGGNEPDPC